MKLGRLALAWSLILTLAGCPLEAVELFPDQGRVGVDARADAQAAADDAAADDAGAGDAPADDAAAEDAAAEDAAADDAALPDAAPSTCSCRLPFCRTDPECAGRIGAGSRCLRNYCEGSVGSCRVDRECPTDLVCVEGPTSMTPCP